LHFTITCCGFRIGFSSDKRPQDGSCQKRTCRKCGRVYKLRWIKTLDSIYPDKILVLKPEA